MLSHLLDVFYTYFKSNKMSFFVGVHLGDAGDRQNVEKFLGHSVQRSQEKTTVNWWTKLFPGKLQGRGVQALFSSNQQLRMD